MLSRPSGTRQNISFTTARNPRYVGFGQAGWAGGEVLLIHCCSRVHAWRYLSFSFTVLTPLCLVGRKYHLSSHSWGWGRNKFALIDLSIFIVYRFGIVWGTGVYVCVQHSRVVILVGILIVGYKYLEYQKFNADTVCFALAEVILSGVSQWRLAMHYCNINITSFTMEM